jgi:hypothetical protein
MVHSSFQFKFCFVLPDGLKLVQLVFSKCVGLLKFPNFHHSLIVELVAAFHRKAVNILFRSLSFIFLRDIYDISGFVKVLPLNR